MFCSITLHFTEAGINVLVNQVSQPLLHTEFKDIIQDDQNVSLIV